jgi:AAA domain-containing protein
MLTTTDKPSETTNGNGRAVSGILSTISRGKRPRHIFALVYGTDGVGKCVWASRSPSPIFIGAEKGTEQLDVARFPQTDSITELLTQIRALQTEKHEFNTAVLDSLDWVEPLIWKAVCQEGKVETIEQYAGGYGKGYVRALDIWRTLIRELSVLNDKMHVLLIGHAQIKSFQDPELPTAYDRYQLKINDKAAALVREAADAVLFARFETELIRDNGSKAKVRGEGNRIMYTESRPGWDAKNRFNLPFCMPLDWKTFGDAIRAFYGLSGKGNGAAKVTGQKQEPEPVAQENGSRATVVQPNTLEQDNGSERLATMANRRIAHRNDALWPPGNRHLPRPTPERSCAAYGEQRYRRDLGGWRECVGMDCPSGNISTTVG